MKTLQESTDPSIIALFFVSELVEELETPPAWPYMKPPRKANLIRNVKMKREHDQIMAIARAARDEHLCKEQDFATEVLNEAMTEGWLEPWEFDGLVDQIDAAESVEGVHRIMETAFTELRDWRVSSTDDVSDMEEPRESQLQAGVAVDQTQING